MALNIPIKQAGDQLTAGEFNEVVSEVNRVGSIPSYDDSGLRSEIRELSDKVSAITGSVISESEMEAGTLRIGGEEYKLYRRAIRFLDPPTTQGGEKEYRIDSNPIGNDLYVYAGNLVVVDDDGIYYPSAYSIKRIYVSAAFETIMILSCDKAVTSTGLSGTLTIDYIKFDVERVEFTVSVPPSVDKSTVNIVFPPLKYDKKFAYSLIVDDDRVDSNKIFFLVNRKWVDSEKYQHIGQERTTGHTPSKTLGYTDGTGVERRFTYGVACWPGMGNDYVPDYMDPPAAKVGKTYPYLTWPEVRHVMSFGNEIYFHDVRSTDQNDVDGLLAGIGEAQGVTLEKIGTGMKVMVRPNGNDTYVEAAKLYPDIVFITTEGNNHTVDSLGTDVDLRKGMIWRRNCDNTTSEAYMSKITESSSVANKWMCDFTHGPSQGMLDGLTVFNDTYGKDGNDSVWFATIDEIYEYWYIRRFGRVHKEIVDGGVRFALLVPRIKYGRHVDFTVQITNVTFTAGCVSSASSNILGLSCGDKGGKLLVNISLNGDLLSNSERFTALYESSSSEDDKADALYFVAQLREDLREPFMSRITAGETAPVLRSVSINSGSSTTYERAVSVTLGVTGRITHYKAAETPDLSGVDWIADTSKTFSLNLSSGLGTKTVYVQVKNQYGESGVKSSSVILQERPAVTFTVTGKSNNVSYGAVTPATQEVAQGGTASLTATAKSGYVIESWAGASSSTGVGSGSGTATVTDVQSDKTVTCNFKSEGSTPPVTGGDKWILSIGWSYSDAVYDPETGIDKQMGAMVYKDLHKTDGTKSGQMLFAHNGQQFKAGMTANTDKRGYITGDDSGIYPDVYMANLISAYTSSVSGENPTITMTFKSMPNGTYRVRIFSSMIHSGSLGSGTIAYEVNDTRIEKDAQYPLNNASEYVVFEDIRVTDGTMSIKAVSATNERMNPVNIIEIEKIS